MERKEYTSLPTSSSEDILSETETFLGEAKVETRARTMNSRILAVASGLMLLTTLLNGICLYMWLQSTTNVPITTTSEATSLDYFLTSENGKRAPETVERTYWDYDDDFLNDNLTIAHDSWATLFPPGEGLVALTDQEVDKLQLHRSNRAKKDPSKYIYLVGVFHQLHCLSVLRSQTIKLWKDPTFSIQDATYHHTMHCADILRQGLLCASDSMLIFKTDDIKWPGDGGSMTCRNFEALKEWTLARDYISDKEEPEFPMGA